MRTGPEAKGPDWEADQAELLGELGASQRTRRQTCFVATRSNSSA